MNRKMRRHDEIAREYDFATAIRGKYHDRYRQGVKITVTDFETTSRTLVFVDGGAVDAAKLGDVLFLLRGAYAAGLGAFGRKAKHSDSSLDDASALRDHISKLDIKGIDALFSKDLGDKSLITRSVSYHSPLEM